MEKAVKAKDKQLHDTKKENLKLNENLVEIKAECKDLVLQSKNEEKARKKLEKKIETKGAIGSEHFECNLCSSKMESWDHMKRHKRIHHMETKSVQTDSICEIKVDKKIQVKRSDLESDKCTDTCENNIKTFERYSCHYCDFNIVSESQLHEHVKHCSGLIRYNSENKKEPTMNEALEAYLLHRQEVEARQYQCDICYNNFESWSLLGMHRVFTHPKSLNLDGSKKNE